MCEVGQLHAGPYSPCCSTEQAAPAEGGAIAVAIAFCGVRAVAALIFSDSILCCRREERRAMRGHIECAAIVIASSEVRARTNQRQALDCPFSAAAAVAMMLVGHRSGHFKTAF